MNGLLSKYLEFLPQIFSENPSKIITLGEGDTPLIQADNTKKHLNLDFELYLKFEGTNPTGSFKDRGMTAALTAAKLNNKIKAVICASTGNTSAAAAAYAAKAGLPCIVLIPQGKIARGKLVQAVVHGCKIVQINGNFDDAMRLVKSLEDRGELAIVNSINPYRLQGQKTIAFEVIQQLNYLNKTKNPYSIIPDYHCLPVGNAANIAAHWLGYTDFYNQKNIKTRPVMLGYQAEGAAPFILGKPINNPETIATAIRIGNPQSWDLAIKTITESKGWFEKVSDQEILDMQKIIARKEGIFCEPASAASVAGLYKDYKNNKIKKNSVVISTLTGHGLKDPDIILDTFDFKKDIINLDPKKDNIQDIF